MILFSNPWTILHSPAVISLESLFQNLTPLNLSSSSLGLT